MTVPGDQVGSTTPASSFRRTTWTPPPPLQPATASGVATYARSRLHPPDVPPRALLLCPLATHPLCGRQSAARCVPRAPRLFPTVPAYQAGMQADAAHRSPTRGSMGPPRPWSAALLDFVSPPLPRARPSRRLPACPPGRGPNRDPAAAAARLRARPAGRRGRPWRPLSAGGGVEAAAGVRTAGGGTSGRRGLVGAGQYCARDARPSRRAACGFRDRAVLPPLLNEWMGR